jgi:hypothetical protein
MNIKYREYYSNNRPIAKIDFTTKPKQFFIKYHPDLSYLQIDKKQFYSFLKKNKINY